MRQTYKQVLEEFTVGRICEMGASQAGAERVRELWMMRVVTWSEDGKVLMRDEVKVAGRVRGVERTAVCAV